MLRPVTPACLTLLLGACVLQGPPAPRSEYTLETLPTLHAPPPAGASTAADAGAPTPAARAPLPHDTGGPYIYGAKFEPPRGRIIHGMGQWVDGNASYLHMLQDPELMPASRLVYIIVGDWPRPLDSRLGQLQEALAEDMAAGRLPHLDLSLFGYDPETNDKRGVDHEIANTDRYDRRLRDIADMAAALPGPVFMRIGGEFSGEWSDYHAYEYPRAYRKIVNIFREAGAENVAFIWCYEPSGPDDFDVQDERGARWFPGADVIDWFGLDVFETDEFVVQPSRRTPLSRAARAERFLKMARDYGKPVILAESSAVLVEITPDLDDGRRDWEEWFAPYLAFLEKHPEIQAFHYVNTDWRRDRTGITNGWQDARIELNSYISRKWIEELRKPRYLHAPDVALLNGYAEACQPRIPVPREPAPEESGPPAEVVAPGRRSSGR